jgi:hypothetical protein
VQNGSVDTRKSAPDRLSSCDEMVICNRMHGACKSRQRHRLLRVRTTILRAANRVADAHRSPRAFPRGGGRCRAARTPLRGRRWVPQCVRQRLPARLGGRSRPGRPQGSWFCRDWPQASTRPLIVGRSSPVDAPSPSSEPRWTALLKRRAGTHMGRNEISVHCAHLAAIGLTRRSALGAQVSSSTPNG